MDAQEAIERVYWEHRIWPAESGAPKPLFQEVLTRSQIRARVLDYMRKSNALATIWNRPIRAEQLQDEMRRMAAATQAPGVLGELFAALGNDPFTIAETLARQKLVDRLIRNWFANDDRFHGEIRKKAAAALAACGSAACMPSMGGEYRETTWSFRSGAERSEAAPRRDIVPLDGEEWSRLLQRLAERIGGTRQALPIMKPGRLEETPEAFVATAVLSQEADEIRTATVTWPKLSFDEWWRAEQATLRAESPQSRADFTLPSVAASPCAADTWPAIAADPLPLPRYLHSSVWTGTEMIVWGGMDDVDFNSGGRYDPATDSWTPTSTGLNVPDGRHYPTAVWTGTEMIVWGGISGSAMNTGGRYNPSTDTWAPVSTMNAPAGRYLFTAVWTGTEMIVWGGFNGGFAPGGGRYNPLTDTWTPVSTVAATERGDHTAVWTGQEMIVWGGEVSGFPYSNSGGRYNPSTDTWLPTSIGLNVPELRKDHTAVWTGQRMIVWGGRFGAFLNTGGRYDPTHDTWESTATNANVPPGRDQHVAVWTGGEMVVWGGRANDPTGSFYVFLNSGGRYNPSTNTWMPTSTGASVPAGRYQHTGVWTGTEMIVWGGDEPSVGSFNSGGRYSPSTDTWVPTSKGKNVPSPRAHHSGIWTGAEMIVWGGGSPLTNTGGRYDPATDSWTAISMGANLPERRTNHNAVWTGREMVVWGGFDYNSSGNAVYLNTGGRYDPVGDIWTPTSTSSAPLERSDHTAIWTGTRMVVWGGFMSSLGYLNSGGRYDPATDTWTPTSTTNAPSARYLHTAVWTGSTMIIWGGSSGDQTGGQYDPGMDKWTPTSTTNAPSARYLHTAVWTGTTMIVWGGSPATNTGGRYDPGTNMWTPTSIGANVPSPRSGHNAVWTGSDMIVWGGPANTGGRYDPATDMWTPTSTINAPAKRFYHTANWTGSTMIVWGGIDGGSDLNSGGLYCGCPNGTLYYPDADGDGFGNPASPFPSCDGTVPAGHTTNQTDCNDANPSVNPAALEICNGIDDDCDRVIDDVSAPGAVTSVAMSGDGSIAWPPLAIAQGYDVVYGDLTVLRTNPGHFTAATQGCLANNTAATSVVVGAVPSPGQGVWVLVRANNCGGIGTYDGEAGQLGPRDAAIAASPQACP